MPRDYRAENLRRRYGITTTDYAHQLRLQGGRCAICRSLPASPLHVDHDHDTAALRGLLCTACNVGLGQFHDDVELLDAAATYLRRFDYDDPDS